MTEAAFCHYEIFNKLRNCYAAGMPLQIARHLSAIFLPIHARVHRFQSNHIHVIRFDSCEHLRTVFGIIATMHLFITLSVNRKHNASNDFTIDIHTYIYIYRLYNIIETTYSTAMGEGLCECNQHCLQFENPSPLRSSHDIQSAKDASVIIRPPSRFTSVSNGRQTMNDEHRMKHVPDMPERVWQYVCGI